MTECEIMRLEKAAMIRVLHEEPAFSEMFISHLLARTIRVEEDLVDQLFNSSEKRLARPSFAGEFWQGRSTRTGHREGQPRDARGADRHYTVSRELLHEQISQIGVH
jgi:CRP/FNR family transcriptional regulator, cyclic AMP receptor protein